MKKIILICLLALSSYAQGPKPSAPVTDTKPKSDFTAEEQRDYIKLWATVALAKNALLEAELAIPNEVKVRLELASKRWQEATAAWEYSKKLMDMKCEGTFDNDFKCVKAPVKAVKK